METKHINCPNCNKPLEYWTLGTSIECTGCKSVVQVEPCEPEVIEEITEGEPNEETQEA